MFFLSFFSFLFFILILSSYSFILSFFHSFCLSFCLSVFLSFFSFITLNLSFLLIFFLSFFFSFILSFLSFFLSIQFTLSGLLILPSLLLSSPSSSFLSLILILKPIVQKVITSHRMGFGNRNKNRISTCWSISEMEMYYIKATLGKKEEERFKRN